MAAPAERGQVLDLPLRPAVCIASVMAVQVLIVGNYGEPAGDVAAAAIGARSNRETPQHLPSDSRAAHYAVMPNWLRSAEKALSTSLAALRTSGTTSR
jgi:hypothetical protein